MLVRLFGCYLQRNTFFVLANDNICVLSSRCVSQTAAHKDIKQKKKMDPQLFKLKVERKVRRLEREIKKLKQMDKQLIPSLEYQLSPDVTRNLEERQRNDSEYKEALENMAKISILNSFYRAEQAKQERMHLQNALRSQSKALLELRKISEELYTAAIAVDPTFLPFTDNKIVKSTAPAKEYEPSDGTRLDITREWKM